MLVACFWAASSASPQTHLAPGGDKARVASAVQAPTCGVKRGKRVFVGFSSDMTLDAFEPAAVHAEHIMHTVGAQLCAAWRSSAPARVQIESSLRSAFSTGATLRVTDVLFGSADFASADVRLALVDAHDPTKTSTHWLVHMRHADEQSWSPVSTKLERN